MNTLLTFSLFICFSLSVRIPHHPQSYCPGNEAPSPTASYSDSVDYLNVAGQHPYEWKIKASSGLLTGRYPDYVSFNGSLTTSINGYVTVDVNSHANTGSIVAEFYGYAEISSTVKGEGKWTLRSKAFGGYPDLTNTTSFMQGGIAEYVKVHGCTGQGETFFPEVNCYLCTWGVGDIMFNDEIVYDNTYFHLMYTDRTRDVNTYAMYANADRTQIYSNLDCSEGFVDKYHKELHIIAGRYCNDPAAFPPVSAVMQLVFTDVQDISSKVLPDSPLTYFFPLSLQPQLNLFLSQVFGINPDDHGSYPSVSVYDPSEPAAYTDPNNSDPYNRDPYFLSDLHNYYKTWHFTRNGTVEMTHLTYADNNDSNNFIGFAEGTFDNKEIQAPIAVLYQSTKNAHNEKFIYCNVYYSYAYMWGLNDDNIRYPITTIQGNVDPTQGIPNYLKNYQRALASGNVEEVLNTYEENGSFTDASGLVWKGADELRDFYKTLLSRDSEFKWLSATVGNEFHTSHRITAIEYNLHIFDGNITQAGLAVYEEGDHGKILAVRTYDELIHRKSNVQ